MIPVSAILLYCVLGDSASMRKDQLFPLQLQTNYRQRAGLGKVFPIPVLKFAGFSKLGPALLWLQDQKKALFFTLFGWLGRVEPPR